MRPTTSLRGRPQAETEAIARALMRPLGLSALTDITHRDRLGLPVFVSTRRGAGPMARHAGKGLAPADARVGALMEGVEHAVAERASAAGPDARLLLHELVAQWPAGLQLRDFAPRLGVVADPAQPVMAARCENLMDPRRRAVLLPAELVLVPCPPGDGPALFGWSSNGLASGNTLEEATLHALLEVLERDAIAMNAARGTATAVDIEELPPALRRRALAWRALGVHLILRHLPGDIGLPCFEATLHESGHVRVALARGWGIHLRRDIALARAVSEAAQSRLCMLVRSGGPGPKARSDDAAARQRVLARLAETTARQPLAELPHHPARSIGRSLRWLLARLDERGLGPVFRRRMQLPGGRPDLQGLHVVKLVVPRCETVLGPHPRMGPRLLAQVLGRADGA